MEMSLVCINCPKSCILKVIADGNQILVEGNSCKNGIDYAVSEITNPTRVVTTIVYVENGDKKLLPVKTSSPIPKGLIMECMRELKKVKAKAPIKIGDVIVKNILNTGADIVATGNVEALKGHQ